MQNKNVVKNQNEVKSTKIINAEKFREKQSGIKIIADEDFLELINSITKQM